ncbi:unnamed protein product [Mytilus coruscus]|uniref:Ig-like domain-containing protein n=1 Tax=Mytilus coruscus TaxID=42192 RepID=A0A6J8AG97_MYTCO|nr:unnamed protein product [Mytilus coruscus]
MTTPAGLPMHISSDETVRVDSVVGGKKKYGVMKYEYSNRKTYQLIIRSVKETDAGNYTCQIYLPNQNYKEWPQKTVDLIVFTNAFGPEIVDDILPEVQRQGQTAYLDCAVINLQSTAQLQWIKQTTSTGNPMHISSGETVRVDSVVGGRKKYDVMKYAYINREIYQLIIRSVTETDAGNYTCQIYLPNQNYKEWPRKSMDLIVFRRLAAVTPAQWRIEDPSIHTVAILLFLTLCPLVGLFFPPGILVCSGQRPPTIKADNPAKTTARQADNITLVCDFNGYPLPNITWKRNDGLPMPNGEFQERGIVYKIYGTSVTDRGMFICTADNGVKPPASFTVQLDVTFAPICTAVQDVVAQGQNQRFDAKLECLVTANSRAEVSWYKANRATGEKEQILDKDKYNLHEQYSNYSKPYERWYTLAIKNVLGNDYGDYYCTAQNEYGENQAKVTLFSICG